MNPRAKKVLIVLGALWGIPMMAILVVGLWVKSLGMISVQVAEHGPGGSNVNLQIPGALASAGLMFLPDVVCAEMADNMDDRWGTVVKALGGELSRCPDAVFVQVKSPDETVLIRKEGVHLVIDVDSDDETVHVRVPIKLVTCVLSRIEGHHGITRTCLRGSDDCRIRRVNRVVTGA